MKKFDVWLSYDYWLDSPQFWGSFEAIDFSQACLLAFENERKKLNEGDVWNDSLLDIKTNPDVPTFWGVRLVQTEEEANKFNPHKKELESSST